MQQDPEAGSEDFAVLVEVLGVCRVLDPSGEEIDLSSMQRRILTRLSVGAPSPVSVEDLAAAIWDDNPPSTVRAALQNQISRIRSRLGTESILTGPKGYCLDLACDSELVTTAVGEAELALRDGRADDAFRITDDAMGRWRGAALEDLEDLVDLEYERRRLSEVYRAAEHIRLAAAIESKRYASSVSEAERLVGAEPHDEFAWALLVRALDGAGRRGDALGAYARARRVLAEDLGLDPGPALQLAEASVLGERLVGRRGGVGRFVGRSELIHGTVNKIAAGGVVVLVGESGVGKTALLRQIERRLSASKMHIGSTQCVEHPGAAVSTLAELLADMGEELERASEPLTGFKNSLERLRADGRPIVLVVDDLQFVGPTSLRALSAACAEERVALVGAAVEFDANRAEDLHAELVPVPPLSDREVAELAGTMREPNDELDPVQTRWLIDMSGGNPLLLEYLMSDPWSAQSHRGDDQTPLTAPSVDVRSAVRHHLQNLDQRVRETLDLAAVCGEEIPMALLKAQCPSDAIRATLATGLLELSDRSPSSHLRFHHGAIRAVLYTELPPGQREELHDEIASAMIDNSAPASTVAAHTLSSRDLDPLRAADWALRAAADASLQGAHEDAARWCRRALGAAETADPGGQVERVTAMVRLGDAMRLAGSLQHGEALFEAADAAIQLGDPALVADATFALLQLGTTTESGSFHSRAIKVADTALELLVDPEHIALVSAATSLAISMSDDSGRCQALFETAERTPTSSATRRKIIPFAYLALGHPRHLDRRVELAAELLTLSRKADDPVGLFEAFHLSYSVGLQRADGDGVRQAVAEMEVLVERVGDVGRQWSLMYLGAALAHLDGQLERSETLATEALELFAPVSPSRAFATYSAQLLVIRLAQGRVDELAESIDELVRDQPAVPAWHAALALSLVDTDPERASVEARLALDGVAEDFTWLAGHVIGARAAAATADDETIRRYVERLLPWSGLVCWQGTCAYGPVDTPLAMLFHALGEAVASHHHLSAARRLTKNLQAPVFTDELDAWQSRM